MLIIFFLNLIIFSCSQAENVFDKFLSGSIDRKVNPCDNFYRHACRKDIQVPISKFYIKPVQEMFENSVYKSKSEESSYFQKNLETSAGDLMTTSANKAINEFENVCARSSAQATKYIVKLAKTLAPISQSTSKCVSSINKNVGCEIQKDRFTQCMNHFVSENPIKSIHKYIKNFIYDKLKVYNWMVNEGSTAVQRMNDTLEAIRKNAIDLIEETPWIKNAKKVKVFEKLANSVNFPNVFEIKLEGKEDSFQKAAKRFSECVQNYGINGAMANIVCLFDLKEDIKVFTDKSKDVVLTSVDGENEDGELHFGESFYHAAEDLNESQYMAFVGASLIGHEFGHSIILDDGDLIKDENLIFSNKTRQCVDQAFTDSCELFEEGDCTLRATQFDDNGADLIGFQIAFDLFKTQLDTSANITEEEKMFFYSFAAGWCERFPRTADGQHQATNLRVNAVVSQIPEFRTVFECEADSPMVTSNKNQCTLFGKNAPETKHREHFRKI